MRKKFLPLLILIVCNIVMVLGTLYITRHSITDLEHTIYVQRDHYKTLAMTRMANYFYVHDTTKSEEAFGKFLANTIVDRHEAHLLARFEPEKGYPWVWIGGNQYFKRYLKYGSLMNSIKAADSSGNVEATEFTRFLANLSEYRINGSRDYIILTNASGEKFLLSYTIIPEPTPGKAKYLYMALTPTADLIPAIEEYRDKNIIMFSIATALAGMMLILIPITIKRFLV